jgi:O-antigen ligase/tetratricopeptide (TPR) repeat protein
LTDEAGLASPGEVDYPPLLASVLFKLLGIGFMLVLLIPLAASLEALLHRELPFIDGGANTALGRAVLNSLVLASTVFLLMLPPAGGSDRLPVRIVSAFLFWWALAATTSVCLPDSFGVFVTWLVAALFMVIAREIACTRAAFELALHVLLAIGVMAALIGLRFFVTGETDAVTGAFYQADVTAGYLLMLVPLAVSLLIGARKTDQRIFYFVAALVLTTALVLTYSRGGYLSTAGALVVVAIGLFRQARARAVLLPLLVVALAFLGAGLLASGGRSVFPSRVVDRFEQLGRAAVVRVSTAPSHQEADSSVTARLDFWRGGLRMALARPLTGWGPGTYGRIYPRYQGTVRYYSKFAHSAYVTVLSEGGFPALLAFLVFLGTVGVAGWRQAGAARQAGPWNAAAVWGLYAALGGAAAHILIDLDWEFPMLEVTFFALIGLMLSRGAADGGGASVQPTFSSHRAMHARWALCLPVMALLAVQPFPFLSWAHTRAAATARNEGDVPAGLRQDRMAAQAWPFNGFAWRNLADSLLVQAQTGPAPDPKDVEGAVGAARRAVRIDPDRAVFHDMLARALLVAGRKGDAEAEYRQAIKCDPINYPNFYNALAELVSGAGHDDEALRLLHAIADRYPPEVFSTMLGFRRDLISEQLARTWMLVGVIELKASHLPLARAAFERATALAESVNGGVNETALTAHFHLGTLLMNLGQPGLAYVEFRAIQQLKPAHGVTRWLMGLCYRELGQAQRAAELLSAAWREYPDLRDGSPNPRIPPDFFRMRAPPNPVRDLQGAI